MARCGSCVIVSNSQQNFNTHSRHVGQLRRDAVHELKGRNGWNFYQQYILGDPPRWDVIVISDIDENPELLTRPQADHLLLE
jgi:hypothetical protein